MSAFGLSFTAAFAHVANCCDEDVPFNWQALMAAQIEQDGVMVAYTADTVEVPEVPAGTYLRRERANGLSTRMARAVAAGLIDEGEGGELLGTKTEIARRWFHEKVEIASADTGLVFI